MNLGLISLICLLAAIVIGFVKNCNVGILCTGIAAVLALVFGIKASDIIKGFSASLCIQMVGITYLFAIINGNGTLELLARKMVALVGKQKRLIPFVIYILGFIISAVGPGAIPSLAIIPVIAIPKNVLGPFLKSQGIRRHQPDYDGDHRRPGRYVRTYESADPGGSRCP